MRILNVSELTTMHGVTSIDTHGIARLVALERDLLAIADEQAGALRLIDVTQTDAASEVGSLATDGDAHAVALVDGIAWMADGIPGLLAISASNPSTPGVVGIYNSPGEALDLAVSADIAYVADGWAGGLIAVSTLNPAQPSFLTGVDTDGRAPRLAVSGSRIALLDGPDVGIVLVSADQSAGLIPRGIIHAPGYAWDVDIVGPYAYIANGYGGLWCVSVATPWMPVSLGAIDTGPESSEEMAKSASLTGTTTAASGGPDTGAESLAIQAVGDTVYLADAWAGLRAVDVSTPEIPRLAGSVDNTGRAQAVDVAGEIAYLADGVGGLRLIAGNDQEHLTEISHSSAPVDVTDVAVIGYIRSQSWTSLSARTMREHCCVCWPKSPW